MAAGELSPTSTPPLAWWLRPPEVGIFWDTSTTISCAQFYIYSIYRKPVLLDKSNFPLRLNGLDSDGKFRMFWNQKIQNDHRRRVFSPMESIPRDCSAVAHVCPYLPKSVLEQDKTCLKCISWYLVYLVLFPLGNFITYSAASFFLMVIYCPFQSKFILVLIIASSPSQRLLQQVTDCWVVPVLRLCDPSSCPDSRLCILQETLW